MRAMLKAVFWGSAAGIVWTHAGYPLAAGAAARLHPRPVRKGAELPRVTVVIAAHNEEDVIERSRPLSPQRLAAVRCGAGMRRRR